MAMPIATGILFDTIVPENDRSQLLVVALGCWSSRGGRLFHLGRDIALCGEGR